MAVDTNALRTALRSVAVTATGFPPTTHRAWENRQHDAPTDGEPWFRETLIPATEGLTAYNYLESRGIAQYDVLVPSGGGTESADTLAKAIMDVFTPPVNIVHSGVTVIVERAERGQASNTDGWYMIPLRVYWRHHTPNT